MSKRLRIIIIIGASIIAVALIGVVILVALPSKAASLDLNAKLSEITGTVEVRNTPQDTYSPVNDGFILKLVQQLQTQQQSRVRLDLSTGTILRLGQSTIFSLSPSEAANGGVLARLEMQVGKVWIVLKGGSLDVNIPGGLASVRGSYMSVWVQHDTNKVTVCCLEGTCAYKNTAGTAGLTSGQKIISTDTNIAPVVQPMDQTDIQDWIDNSPESAGIIPQVLQLLGLSMGSATPTLTATPTGTATATPTPTPTATPTTTPTPTFGLGTGIPLSTLYPFGTPTPTRTYVYRYPTATQGPPPPPGGGNQPTATQSRPPTATQPPPPPPTATQPPPPTDTQPAPTDTPIPYP